MHKMIIPLAFLLLAGCKSRPAVAPVVYLAGDSTIADKRDDRRPETGWGEKLGQYFDGSIRVSNHAVNGRSTKSFRDEGRWRTVLDQVRAGDYVFIGFGHNDGKADTARYSSPAQFGQNLERFVREIRARNAEPVILTPIVRRKFDDAGRLKVTHGEYPDEARATAAKLDVPLIDLTVSSRTAIQAYGPDKSKELYLWLQAGENPNYPEGVEDDTHLSPAGASLIAGLVARQIADLRLPLKRYLKTPASVSSGN